MKKLALATTLLTSLNASAALYDRGNGMIYDSDQNITWLQDANYAATSGYAAQHATSNTFGSLNIQSDGRMGWDAATSWASQLVYGGYDDWRLPTVGTNPTSGYNITSSEIGHLFYVDLGNKGNQCAPNCLTNASFIDGSQNVSLTFMNVQPYVYWYADTSYFNHVWGTHLGFGNSDNFYDINWSNYAWAVRDGDVAAVPVPAAAWLFGSGLLGLAGAAKRRRNSVY